MKTRISNFATSLALTALLLISTASSARADSDDGIVRVKSAVPMAGGDHPHQGRHRRQGHQVLLGDRPVEARGRRRHQAAPVDAAGVRQSAARNPVHHVQSQCRARLAGAAAADPGRQWRRLGGVDRFRVDRPAPQHPGPRRAVQDGHRGGHLDHVDDQDEMKPRTVCP